MLQCNWNIDCNCNKSYKQILQNRNYQEKPDHKGNIIKEGGVELRYLSQINAYNFYYTHAPCNVFSKISMYLHRYLEIIQI